MDFSGLFFFFPWAVRSFKKGPDMGRHVRKINSKRLKAGAESPVKRLL